MRWVWLSVLAGLWACGGDEADDGAVRVDGGALDGGALDGGALDGGAFDGGAVDAAGLPTGCSADDPEACLYRPARTYEVEVVRPDDLTYTDAIGQPRTVYLAVHRPVGAPTPLPVVLLSHGGAEGKTNPLNSMDKWSNVLARSGYLAVAIAHEGRALDSYLALCEHLGVPNTEDFRCGIKIHWDRAPDVGRVLDWLEEVNGGGPLAGTLDLDRVAHMGHSAGAGAASALAGATRNFVCAQPFGMGQGTVVPCDEADLVSVAEPRLRAAIGMAPQGPGSEGFMDASFGHVGIPFLMATGTRDGDPGEPENRAALFDLLPDSANDIDFIRFFIEDEGAKHTLFEGEIDACVPLANRPRCEAMRGWLFSLGVAFLDAHLREAPAAAAWLASDALELAAGGDGTLSRR